MKTKLLGLIVLTLLLFSCKSQKNETAAMEPLKSGLFKVTTLEGKDLEDAKVTLRIDLEKNRVSGNTGCNNYSAGLKLDSTHIETGLARATKMYCEDKMEIERSFLNNLGKAESYSFDGKTLKLKSADGTTLITAIKAEKG